MKRALSFILSIIMILSVSPLVFAADQATCEHTVAEWDYWQYSGPDDNYDCTDPDRTYYRAGYCTKCSAYISEEIPTLPEHNYVLLPMYDEDGRIIEGNYKAPTCEEPGYNVYECTVCTKKYYAANPAIGHAYGEKEILVRCFADETGLRNGTYRSYCTNVGCEAYIDEGIVDHLYIITEGVEADCFKPGNSDYRYCAECSTASAIETYPQIEHKDEDANGRCDLCFSVYREEDGEFCSCLCHNEGAFVKLLLPILTIIWKILGIDNCNGTCNAAHY